MPRRDVIPSPNIWNRPDVYEQENLGVDPSQVIEKAMREIHDWAGRTVLDIGCGTGFHLPRFAGSGAAKVIGVEPHEPLLAAARRRCASSPHAGTIDVCKGTAQRLPVPDTSVDVAHARWAYFFGPGCEPGLDELSRVMRRGGTAFVIDNDATRSTFGGWFRRATRDWRKPYDPAEIERFWALRGWQRMPLDIWWDHPDRATFESVVRIEFASDVADEILAGHEGTTVDYAVNLFWRTFS